MLESAGGLARTQIHPSLVVSVSVGLRYNLRLGISLKFLRDAQALETGDPLRVIDYKITPYALSATVGLLRLFLTVEFPRLFSPVLFPNSLSSGVIFSESFPLLSSIQNCIIASGKPRKDLTLNK